MIAATKIRAFWNWFEKAAPQIELLLSTEDRAQVASILDARVNEVSPQVGWEVGPGCNREFAIAITWRANTPDSVEEARQIVERAPDVRKWEVCFGRPPKDWNWVFTMRNRSGQVVDIDAARWRYAISIHDEPPQFDILLVTGTLPKLDSTARRQAGWIVVQSALGDALMHAAVDTVECVDEAPPETEERLSAIGHLKAHIDMLLQQDDLVE